MRSIIASLLALAVVTQAVAATDSYQGQGQQQVKRKCTKKTNHRREKVSLPIPESEYEVKPQHPGDDHYKLKTGNHGEYLGPSRGAAQAPFTKMHAVPVPRKSYQPVTTIKAAYAADIPAADNPLGHQHAVVVADCEFKTKKPTINLANFPQITGIKCSESTVSLTFATDASAAKAHEEWIKAKEFAIMVPRHAKCNGKDEVAMRDVSLTKLADKGQDVEGQIVFTTAKAHREDVIDEFVIEVKQYMAPANATGLSKRGIFDWNKDKLAKWTIGINTDNDGNAVKPSITMYEYPGIVRASCENCLAYGQAGISLKISGTAFVLKTYEVELSGELKANIGLKVEASKTITNSIEVPLFVLPLSPVSIPGVLTLGPELRLKAAASYNVAGQVLLTTGTTLSIPYKWTAGSQNGLFSPPKARSEGKPSLELRPVTLTGEVTANAEAHLIPSFVLGLSVWKIPAFTLDLEWDSALGVDAVAKGRATIDHTGAGAEGSFAIEAYHKHELDLGIKSAAFATKEWTLWTSGRLVIPGAKYQIQGSVNTTFGANRNNNNNNRNVPVERARPAPVTRAPIAAGTPTTTATPATATATATTTPPAARASATPFAPAA
ncbi:hypothetical protein BCR44DRAFT_1314101 [Catenaria anguillulae PL171]|uniref:Uncharacterized protein n=1 Tax=Catenaria anguillulae PL171 TaxID=765915 RepID=A0A1Y2H8S4_9FUNG|nr:hypothetical protein BCR44DRAFT_1314101 [Catenaria anguillulae PL171]